MKRPSFYWLILMFVCTQLAIGEQQLTAPGMVMVKFKESPGASFQSMMTNHRSLNAMMAEEGITRVERTFQDLRPSGAELAKVYNFHFSSNKDPVEVARLLGSEPSIEYAEPKYLHELHATPNDPYFGSHQTHLSRMNLPAAWDITKGDSGDIVIAIIDDGVDLDHVEIADILWTNSDEIADNGIDDDLNGYIDDIHGWNFANNTNDPNGLYGTPGYTAHGTRVAGQLANTNNGTIYAGTSWNTKMMVLNAAYQELPLSLLWIYESMIYAAHNGANIISLSGGRRGLYSKVEAEIIEYLQSMGVLIITSAGNRNFNADFNPLYPGNYRGVLMVGATQKTDDTKAGFSVYGTSVDVFAPGTNIPLIWDNDNYDVNGGHGTSFCAPQVAGIAGLVWTANPDWTADMVREQVRISSIPIDDVNPGHAGKMGHGRVDALRALTLTDAPSVRVQDYRVENSMGGDEVISGDTLTISIDLINYLSPVNNLSITAFSTFWPLVVVDSEVSITTLASNEMSTVEIRVLIDGSFTTRDILCLYLDMTGDGDYVDREYVPLHYRDYHTYDVDTGVIQTTLSSDGKIGWLDLGMTQGQGFVYKNTNLLREAGILVANSPDHVSDNLRTQPVSEQDDDFEALSFWDSKDNLYFKTELATSLDDGLAESPLGIRIDQQVLFGANQLPAISNNCIMVIYELVNDNDHVLNDLHFGVFTDWDLSADSLDQTFYDSDRRILYQQGMSNSTEKLAGIFLANDEFRVKASMINNNTVFADGFTDGEKWELMNSAHTDALNDVDASLMLTVGPFDLMPKHQLAFAYVLFAADNLTDVLTLTGTIQSVFDTVYPIEFSSTDPEGVPTEFRLHMNHPNPFNPSTTIGYDIPQQSLVNVTIYDIQGREIRSLYNALAGGGYHEITWDGIDNSGTQVSTGVYLCRVQAGEQSSTIKMLMMK